MKNIVLLMALSLIAETSFAETSAASFKRLPANTSKLAVTCVAPKGFAGLSATMSGELNLTALPNGAAKASGKLKINLLDARNPWSGIKMVMGQYDDLTSAGSERYFHGGATIKNSDDIMEVYVNYTRPDMSFITYADKTYKMACQ